MLIVSQDGTHIYNFDKIESIEVNSYHGIVAKINSNGFILGNYKTEERGLEILDEIKDSYKRTFMTISESMMTDSYWSVFKASANIYHMPKE